MLTHLRPIEGVTLTCRVWSSTRFLGAERSDSWCATRSLLALHPDILGVPTDGVLPRKAARVRAGVLRGSDALRPNLSMKAETPRVAKGLSQEKLAECSTAAT